MINKVEAHLGSVVVHRIGNKHQDEDIHTSHRPIELKDELRDKLLDFFTNAFTTPQFYEFTFSDEALELNPVYNFAGNIFDDEEALLEESVKIARYLYDQSTHPNIKSGDLIIGRIDSLLIDDELVDALAIFKCENQEDFIKVADDDRSLEIILDKGIDLKKPDKGCIIFNTDRDKGFKICIIDHSNTKMEAKYWSDDFLTIRAKDDNYHATTHYITMTKSFIKERIPHVSELDKVDEIEILNNSKKYFEKNENFEKKEYTAALFKNEQLAASFEEFSQDYDAYKNRNSQEEFEINKSAVKKKTQVFKSVLKLDKNFHIYIHGDRSKIEKGTDHDGKKFYKIYYDEER